MAASAGDVFKSGEKVNDQGYTGSFMTPCMLRDTKSRVSMGRDFRLAITVDPAFDLS